MKRKFNKELEEYGREASTVPLGTSSERVWARVNRDESASFGWRLVAACAAAAAFVVVGLAVWKSRESRLDLVVGFSVQRTESAEVAQVGDMVVVSRGECVLSDQDVVLNASADTSIRRGADGIQLVRGKVTVTARHRQKRERQLQIRVSGGVVHVVGTRFTLTDDGTHGTLSLHEGMVRFISLEGETTELRAGEQIAWPRKPRADLVPPVPVPAPLASPTIPEKSDPPPDAPRPQQSKKHLKPVPSQAPVAADSVTPNDLGAALEHVAVLRNRGQYEAAIEELERLLARVGESNSRERLSFEIGSVLTHQIRDQARACEHWRKHAKLFGAGRYQREIQLLNQQLRCE